MLAEGNEKGIKEKKKRCWGGVRASVEVEGRGALSLGGGGGGGQNGGARRVRRAGGGREVQRGSERVKGRGRAVGARARGVQGVVGLLWWGARVQVVTNSGGKRGGGERRTNSS